MATPARLREGSLGRAEVLGQSVASIAPTFTPAINISVVAGLAGVGSWVSFLIAAVAMLFVATSIGTLARRHPLAGSYFVYIGRTLGPLAGLVAGWSIVAGYLAGSVAVVLGFTLFVADALDAFGAAAAAPPGWALAVAVAALVWCAAWRDVRLSLRTGLVLEAVSIGLIVLIVATVIASRGQVIDPAQFDPSRLGIGGIMSGLTFAVFCFAGFESAATLAREAREPAHTVSAAITLSTLLVGLFFVAMAYCMVLAMGDDAAAIGNSPSPLTELIGRAGLGWAAGIVYVAASISAFASALALVNAAARMIFSMSRFRLLGRPLGSVHPRHRTPHVAVTCCCLLVVVLSLALLPLGALDAFGYAGTFGTFGFLVVYLLICVVSPLDLHRAGAMRARHAVVGAAGAALMAFVVLGSLVPLPPWPGSLIPYLFALYLAAGVAWFAILRRRDPAALATLAHDWEA